MIEVQNITKNYGPFQALKDISFQVDKGQIVGFLGPNGSRCCENVSHQTLPLRSLPRLKDISFQENHNDANSHLLYASE